MRFKLLFFIVLFSFFSMLAKSQTDSLIQDLERAKTSEEKIRILNSISKSYWYKSPAKVIEYGHNALALAEEINNDTLIVNSKLNIGIGYSNLGEHFKAMSLYIQCLEASDKIKYLQGQSGAWSNLAILYDNMGDYEKARNSNLNALSIFKKMNHVKGIVGSLNNIGINYTKTKEYDKAYEYYKEALDKETTIGDKQMIAITLVNIGDVFDFKGDQKTAISYYEKSLKAGQELNNSSVVIVSLINLGRMKQSMGDYNGALGYFNKSLDFAQKFEFRDFTRDIYKYLSSIYQLQNNIPKAFDFYKKYSDLKDSLSSSESKKRIAELHIKYETDAKQKENEILSKENKYQQNLIYFFYLLGFMVLIIGVVVFRNYLQKKKTNVLLLAKNQIITEQKDKLNESLISLQKSEELYRSLVTTSPDGILIADLNAIINYVSPAMLQILGLNNKNEILGIKPQVFIHKSSWRKAFSYFNDIKMQKNTGSIELLCVDKNGNKCEIEINGSVLKDINGNIDNLFFILRNVSERKQIENENKKNSELIFKQQQEITKLELIQREQENIVLKNDLDYRIKELASKAMYIVQNNERNISMIKALRTIEKKIESKEKITSSEVRSVISELNIVSRNDSWNEFEAHFIKVHKDFYDNLSKQFPDLSSNERKLCAFLRLNLSTKEISEITNKSIHSIDVARTRLRQKLGLSNTGDNLVIFLSQL
ncbi:MAG: tetratricopeptide repeat protein [Bacteroidota bacterium]